MSTDRDQGLPSEQGLIERARDSVDKHSLPDNVARKLRLARAEAVEVVSDSSTGWFQTRGKWLVPAGAASALAITLFINQDSTIPVMPLFDEQALEAAANMELLDDIEFLAWMLEEAEGVEPDDG